MTFCVRQLHYPAEAPLFGTMRYVVFVQQLGWVVGDPTDQVEFDELDKFAHHFGVFTESGDLVGYVRLLHNGKLLLQQMEFASLLSLAIDFNFDATVLEVSRMCVRPDLQKRAGRRGGLAITRLLFRAIYDYALKHESRWLLAIADDVDKHQYSHKAFLMKSFPFSVIAGPVQFEGSGNVYLLALDIVDAVKSLAVRRLLGL